MHSPPSSSEIFFSSPPRDTGNGPEDEVEFLFASAQRIKSLDHNLFTYIANNKADFLDVFGRQVQLLKSRSQAFEDAHVTVYDKVLLLLTRNGNDLESPAAMTWYCTEFLGLNLEGDPDYNHQLMDQAVMVPNALSQALTPMLSRKSSETVIDGNPGSSSTRLLENSRIKGDPVFVRLWSVYSKAHADYLAIADQGDTYTLEAAKFLRDTAENGIHYLRDKYPKDPALTELTNTYNTAKIAVLKLNGGKKRKFDKVADHRGEEVHAPNTRAHNQVSYMRRRIEKNNSQGRERKRGRGPSGIPFGYSRQVDSYYPA